MKPGASPGPPAVWGENLTVTSSVDWIEISGLADEVEPYGNTTFNIKVYREGLEPGSYGEYLTLWYNNRFMQYVNVEVEVGSLDAVPVGVEHNFVRIPADESHLGVNLLNNSDTTWWDSAGYPLSILCSEDWVGAPIVSYTTIPPGDPGWFTVELDRNGLSPGIHKVIILLFFYDSLVQTIMLEMEVGE
jgi:hypothetical protein